MLAKNISEFLNQKDIAVVGVSRKGNGFGSLTAKLMKQSGYDIFSINKNAGNNNGDRMYNCLSNVPGKIQAVVTVVPPYEAINVINEAVSLDIKYIWMQPGSESNEAKQVCKENGMEFISGNCILMYMQSAGFIHKVHRWVHDKFEHRKTQAV